jgi:hypothetical protein
MRRSRNLSILLLLPIILLISGCEEECTFCCNKQEFRTEYTITSLINYDFELYTGTVSDHPGTIYYYNLPGSPAKIQFFIGRTISGLCTQQHLYANYEVGTSEVASDRVLKVFGEVYWSVFSDEFILRNEIPPTNTMLAGTLTDVGLKQAFPEGAAQVDVYLNIEFESLGSFAQDKQFFLEHITFMGFNFEHYLF